MSAPAGYLVNTVKVNYPGQGTSSLKAGTYVSDPVLIAGVAAAGGQLVQGTPSVLAAVAIVNKLRGAASAAGQGQNEDMCDKVMLAAITTDAPQVLVIDIPLSLIILQTAATPFNIGAVLPTPCRVLDCELYVLQKPAGTGPLTDAHAEVGTAAGGIDDLLGLTDIFQTASATVPLGTAPQGGTGGVGHVGGIVGPTTRSGIQLQMNITESGSALSAWTAGHLSLQIYYLPS